MSTSTSTQFWAIQLGFWFMVALVSLFSLTLWYGQFNWLHLSHMLAQSVLGILFSLPLYWVSLSCWHWRPVIRSIIVFVTVALVALLWTLVRLELFAMMVADDDVWRDFGGWYFGSIFIYLCWAGFFHGVRYARLLREEHEIMLNKAAEAKKQELKTLSAQAVARDAKLKMLRYQLNPHFLCNSLNAINALIEVDRAQTAQKMSVQLSKFLRFSLDTDPDTKIALEQEIYALNLYLEIEKVRFGERLSIDLVIADDAKKALIPSLLLQPIIENSMKHVIDKSEQGGAISLHAGIEDNNLVLTIQDTGDGVIEEQLNTNSRGIGLKNIDERLTVLYGEGCLNLSTTANGGLVTQIRLPFEQG